MTYNNNIRRGRTKLLYAVYNDMTNSLRDENSVSLHKFINLFD